jgi:hypothetical protein
MTGLCVTKDHRVAVAWIAVLDVYRISMTASFLVCHMIIQRVCGTLTRTRQHEVHVNLLSIPDVSDHMASTLSH